MQTQLDNTPPPSCWERSHRRLFAETENNALSRKTVNYVIFHRVLIVLLFLTVAILFISYDTTHPVLVSIPSKYKPYLQRIVVRIAIPGCRTPSRRWVPQPDFAKNYSIFMYFLDDHFEENNRTVPQILISDCNSTSTSFGDVMFLEDGDDLETYVYGDINSGRSVLVGAGTHTKLNVQQQIIFGDGPERHEYVSNSASVAINKNPDDFIDLQCAVLSRAQVVTYQTALGLVKRIAVDIGSTLGLIIVVSACATWVIVRIRFDKPEAWIETRDDILLVVRTQGDHVPQPDPHPAPQPSPHASPQVQLMYGGGSQ